MRLLCSYTLAMFTYTSHTQKGDDDNYDDELTSHVCSIIADKHEPRCRI